MKVSAVLAAALLFVSAGVASAQEITDAQIAHIVVTANQVDIDAGKLAASNGTNAEVKKFGQQMVTDHTGVNKQATDLATKLKVTPADNPTSKSLKEGGDKNIAKLKGLKGAEFDKAYMDNEVAYHQAVHRRGRQDPHPRRQECRAQGPAGQDAPGVRRAPRACQEGSGLAQVGLSPYCWARCSSASGPAPRPRPPSPRRTG